MNIKELAEQAGVREALLLRHYYGDASALTDTEQERLKQLERFAELVAAAERESCAELCEERKEYQKTIPCPDGIAGCCVAHFVRGSKIKDGRECAAAIRARGDKHE